MEKQQEILDFWFGELFSDGTAQEGKRGRWYKKDREFDALVKEKFGEDVEKARVGKYDKWRETPEGALALILLLDQFARNIYRDTKERYAGDKKAQNIALDAVENGFDGEFLLAKRQFMYMPLMHAENRKLQKQSVLLFRALTEEVAERLKKRVALHYAKKHADIIEQFGRFPYRNKILGRDSTPEEIIFLQQSDSNF